MLDRSRTYAARSMCRLVTLWMLALAPASVWAAEPVPRSVLILDQSDTDSVWFSAFSLGFRTALNARSARPVSLFAKHLDLSRFSGPPHEETLRAYLREKFRDKPNGVLV